MYDGIYYQKKPAQGYNAQNKRRYLIYQKKKIIMNITPNWEKNLMHTHIYTQTRK